MMSTEAVITMWELARMTTAALALRDEWGGGRCWLLRLGWWCCFCGTNQGVGANQRYSAIGPDRPYSQLQKLLRLWEGKRPSMA